MVILRMFVRGTRKNVSTANMLYTFLVVDTIQLLNMSSSYKFQWLFWLLASPIRNRFRQDRSLAIKIFGQVVIHLKVHDEELAVFSPAERVETKK